MFEHFVINFWSMQFSIRLIGIFFARPMRFYLMIFCAFGGGKKIKFMWNCSLLAMLLVVWLERNSRFLGDSTRRRWNPCGKSKILGVFGDINV